MRRNDLKVISTYRHCESMRWSNINLLHVIYNHLDTSVTFVCIVFEPLKNIVDLVQEKGWVYHECEGWSTGTAALVS